MATDIEQQIREATKAILDADTALRTLFGRTTRIAVERWRVGLNTPLPVLAFDLLAYDEGAERGTMLLTAIAKDTNSGAVCRNALELAKAALTYNAYEAQGLNYLAPQVDAGLRQSVDEVGDISGLLELDEPTLTQADWSLPLLVLT
jgi:hypothetical protein